MIAAWMAYCLGVTTLLAAGALALDRALRLGRRPTRWVWAGALGASLAFPVAARLRPEAFTTVTVPTLTTAPIRLSYTPAARPATATPPALPAPSFSLADLDRPLVWLWVGMSAALCVVLFVAAWRLTRLRRKWQRASLEGRAVLVSDAVGPAVASFWSRDLVFPLWTLNLDDRQRRLMLAHEEQHVLARDPWLLAAAGLALVAVPWNVAAWWLVRRLRLAVEVDCDTRVLGRGQDVASYGALLLAVGGRASRRLIGAAALGEPASFLEQRIRSMTAAVPHRYLRRATGLVAVAAGALVLACEAPRPMDPGATDRARDTVTVRIEPPFEAPSVERLAAEVRGRMPWVLNDHRIIWLYFVVDQRDSVVASGAAVLSPATEGRLVRMMIEQRNGRVTAREIVPGFDTLNVGDATVIGKVAATGQHVVVWGVQFSRPNLMPVRLERGSAWVNGAGVATRGDPGDAAELARAVISSRYNSVLTRFAGSNTRLWFVADGDGRVVQSGIAPGASGRISSDEARVIIPGYDTLHYQSLTIFGPGGIRAESPPVLWVQLNAPRVLSHAKKREAATDVAAHARSEGWISGDSIRMWANGDDFISVGRSLSPSRETLAGWGYEAIAHFYPNYLKGANHNPVVVWVLADSADRIIGHSVTNAPSRIAGAEIDAQFPGMGVFRPGEWVGYVAPLGERRPDVRVVWVHSNRTPSATQGGVR